LKIINSTENQIQMRFRAFELNTKSNKYTHEYYLVVAKADAKEAVSYDVAEMRFHEYQAERFFKVEPNQLLTVHLIPTQGAVKPQDIDGADIQTGVPYVAFIYQKLDKVYQKDIGNFSDRITAPSQEFLLATQLSNVLVTDVNSDDTHNAIINFHAEKHVLAPKDLEYRCILIPRATPHKTPSGGSNKKNNSDWFNLDVAKQVARVNYTIAKCSEGLCSFEVNTLTPDNFGNLLVEEKKYTLVILAIAPENQNAYLPSLSTLDIVTVTIEGDAVVVELDEVEPAPAQLVEVVSIVEKAEPEEAEFNSTENETVASPNQAQDVELTEPNQTEAIETDQPTQAEAVEE
ncbi:MAG: hypothetical protein PHN45_12510, partial [Methylococcales bacterium]|nr:hypothetical protein [Methylococcales bacterium]